MAACALYFATAQRTVGWQDSGMFQWRSLVGDYTGRGGLALAHPLYIAAGRVLALLSYDRLPLALNCFSGVGAAVALANLAAVATLLTGRRWIALLTAAMLAVTHATWWLATIAEVYTWSLAGFTLEIWLVVKLCRRPRWNLLAWLALVNGLGLCVHNFALLPLPVYVVTAIVLVARRKLPAWSLAVAAGAWLAGAGIYLAMTANLAVSSGDWPGAIRSALTGGYADKMLNITAGAARLKENIALSCLNFTGLLLPLAVVGWFHLSRRLGVRLAVVLGGITAVDLLFFVTYHVPDQFTFILPSLLMIALAAAVGIAALADRSRRWRTAVVVACLASLIWQPAIYRAGPGLIRMAHINVSRRRKLPFRDEVRYWLVPWKHNERSAELFCRAAFRQASPDGVIVPDSTSQYPLLLFKRFYMPSCGVSVQFDDQPLPNYQADPAGFRSKLGGRALYLVSPLPGHAPEALLKDLAKPFKQSSRDVLYSTSWRSP